MKHIAVIGLGLFGTSVAETLVHQGHYVLGIDVNEQRVQELGRTLNQCVTVGSTDENSLLALGIKEYDAVVVAIGAIAMDVSCNVSAWHKSSSPNTTWVCVLLIV
jgi:trk system potassium uptake protein TrkA